LASDGTCEVQATNIAGRNMVTNGGMGICQRDNSSATEVYASSSTYHLDMYRLRASGSGQTGKYTAQQVEDAPAGFKHSMKLDVTVADTSLTAGAYHAFYIPIEGRDMLRTSFGGSDAKSLTLSFWVKSNLTGSSFGGSFSNSGNNRSYAFNYSISSAGTWEKKSITVPGDTTGSWLTDHRLGIKVTFSLGVGTNFTGTANTWTASELMCPTSATNIVNSTDNYINFTGFQLETGSVATDFEWQSHQVELARCKRYYQQYPEVASDGYSVYRPSVAVCRNATQADWGMNFDTMRAAPTVSWTGNHQIYENGSDRPITGFAAHHGTLSTGWMVVTCSGGNMTGGNAGLISRANDTSAYIKFSTEL
jgi:hypothetical protein